MQNNKFITIVGPTASGKTNLALRLAEEFNGEIICADSRTIYRKMDIGTAKPNIEERVRVRHHLLDVVEPGERLSAAEFKQLALNAMDDIWRRGKVPFLVGGSGLYVDSIIYDYQFPPEADPDLRRELDNMTDEALRDRLRESESAVYDSTDIANRRRVIRAIETIKFSRSRRATVVPGTLVLGITLNKIVAQKRVEQRIEKMLEKGFIEEVQQIGTTYGWDSEALNIIGYRAFKDVVLGSKNQVDGVADFVAGDMALYKKQTTWFRRNSEIHWLDNTDAADGLVRVFLTE